MICFPRKLGPVTKNLPFELVLGLMRRYKDTLFALQYTQSCKGSAIFETVTFVGTEAEQCGAGDDNKAGISQVKGGAYLGGGPPPR